jgi:hypothetical protein
MRESLLLACVAVAGCAQEAHGVVVAAESCRSGPVTLWLDFEGAGVVHAAADDSAAMPVQSLLAPTSAIIPPFDGTLVAPRVSRAQAMASVTDRVRTLLRPFAVDVVTARPAAAPYTRVLVGGSAMALGVSTNEAGVARLDCGNATDADVAFDFSDEQTPDYGGVVGIANTAAHEAGHAFGLEHVDDPHDVMYSVAQPLLTLPDLFTLGFGSGNFSSVDGATRQCTSSDPVDEPSILDCNVGAAAGGGDVTPPTVSWDAPADPVGASFTLVAQASDDVGVVRVEVYKNLELVASLDAPPYQATIDAAAGEQFYVTVEAIDAAANRGTLTRALAAAPPAASTPDGGGPRLGGGDAGAQAMPVSKSGGCSVAAGSPAPWPLGLGLGLGLGLARVARRRRRATATRRSTWSG